ncbi:helix-turn-helix domain-containing protein [Salmonella enterica]|nr:helix-turn-helix domain-containing protein [Salmonella enterica]
MTGLDKAINAAGGKSRLALAIGIKPSSLSRWVVRYQGRVPAERVQQIFQLTGVTPHELRPDLHPNPTDGLCCGVPSATDRQIAGGCQPGMSDLVSASVRESAEAHCAAISNAPLAVREREAIEAIEALAPFAPGHRVLILPREQ